MPFVEENIHFVLEQLSAAAVLNQPLSVNLRLFRSTCRCTPPPRVGKVEASLSNFQCTPPGMEKLKSQANVTFWFWLMYPPPGMEKLKSQVNVTFWFWLMYPPSIGKVEASLSNFQCTPPLPGMEKLKSQVNVTFWFWLMYPSQEWES